MRDLVSKGVISDIFHESDGTRLCDGTPGDVFGYGYPSRDWYISFWAREGHMEVQFHKSDPGMPWREHVMAIQVATPVTVEEIRTLAWETWKQLSGEWTHDA